MNSTIDLLERAAWFHLSIALGVAVVGTLIVFVGWRFLHKRTTLRFALGFIAIIALGVVYATSASQLLSGAVELDQRETRGDEEFATTAYVHPGTLLRLAPAFTVVITWGALLIGDASIQRKNRARSSS